MSKNPGLTICGENVAKGEFKTLMLPMPQLYDCTPLSMPVHVLCGKQTGPTLCLTAAIHGDEINGVEIIRRLLRKKLIKKLKGNLIAIPIVNVYGFLYQNRYLLDRRDLNRSFPGSPKGSLAARLAHLLVSEIISKATHVIDLHAGSLNRTNLPQIRANLENPEICAMALAFHTPIILHAILRDKSLREYANENNIPLLVYEAGESSRFDEISIKLGVSGILRVMRKLEMLPQLKKPGKKSQTEFSNSSFWVRAPKSGLFILHKKLGKHVNKDDLLGTIGDPSSFSAENDEKIYAPLAGIIIGCSNAPLVHEGAALFHIACFEEPHRIEQHIEKIQAIYDDNDTEIENE